MGGFSLPRFGRSRKDKDAKNKAADSAKTKSDKLREERNHWRTIAKKVRSFAAHRYIKGEGIEIGGLHRPLPVYNGARAKYVDRLSTEEIRRFYANVADQPQVSVDIVDDGETLRTVADGSCDFVIANHMLEHTRNPIGTIENFLRVLKPEGIIYMAIPDKRFTFDVERPITPYEHIKKDYLEGPESSDREHYDEWTKYVRKTAADETERQARIEKFLADQTNIHFHAWTQREIIEMFLNMKRDFNFPIEIELVCKNGHELLVILRKANLT